MIEKLKKFFKGMIKNNYKLIIAYTIIILLFTINLDYEIYTSGGLINLDDRVFIENGHESSGNLNLTFVGAKKGIIPLILLSYIIPDWDLVSLNNSKIDTESTTDVVERNKIYLNSVNVDATIAAFKKANREYEIIDNKITVLHVFDYAETSLKTGDIILTIENISLNTSNDLTNIIHELEYDQKVNLKILRDNKEMDAYATIKNIDNEKYIGLYLSNIEDVKTNPNVKIKFKNNELGPSGGLMTALKIYDLLTNEDITKGDIISGTGTIDDEGNIGAISGIKYKLKGAYINHAKVFIVPVDNYKEAQAEKEKNNYDITLIKADTFDNVVDILLNR